MVLDRGPGTGGAWQLRWEALRIGSAHRINDLPGMDALGLSFENADRTLPAKDVVADYYRQYEELYELQVRPPGERDLGLQPRTDLVVEYRDDSVQGDQELVTRARGQRDGHLGFAVHPLVSGHERVRRAARAHDRLRRRPSEFAGKSVVVVGGGTSAIGFLHGTGECGSRAHLGQPPPIEFLDEGELNLEAGAAAVAMQDEAARAGRALPSIVSGTGVPRTRRIQSAIERGLLEAKPMFASIEADGVRWADGTFQQADAIIWSTGFRPELRHLAPLKLREKAGGVTVGRRLLLEGPAHLLRRLRPAGLDDRRQPRRPPDRPPGGRPAQQPLGPSTRSGSMIGLRHTAVSGVVMFTCKHLSGRWP